jgi:succinate dehydrogenase/fumarate reductase cytochrome b subunit
MSNLLHRASAMILALFLMAHITNHLVGLAGQQVHIDMMNLLRSIYRNPVIEILLICLFGWQIASGVRLLANRWKLRDGAIAWAQMTSGAYLAFFLCVHVSAVLLGRTKFGLDTDFRFAAAGFHIIGGSWFFAPYYAFALGALFTHISCAISWRLFPGETAARNKLVLAAALVGALIGILIVLSLSGILYSVDIPDRYISIYS